MISTEYTEFHNTLLEIEADLNLFDFEVDGIRVWERIRHYVATELLAELGITGSITPDSGGVIQRYSQGMRLSLRNTVIRNPLFASQPDLLCFGRGRRVRRDNEWWDLYLDPLHEVTEQNSLQIETAWGHEHQRPERTENLRYVDFIYYLSSFLHQSRFVQYSLGRSERRTIERLEERIRSEFGVDYDVEAQVQKTLIRRKAEKPLYDALLARLDPKLVVLTVYGVKETFIESCHDAGVPVVELQHGQISTYAYNYSFAGDRTKTVFPDYFLSFGDAWQEAADLPLESDRVISVGYPYLDTQLEKHSNIETSDRLLFVSTGESGPRLSKMATELSERPDNPYTIVYKLHPTESPDWQSRYPWLVDSSVEVIDRKQRSLYELFAESTAQVGVGSTALYEGFAFGLDTYLVEMPTVEWSVPLLEYGSATLVQSVDELVEQLNDPPVGSLPRDRFFKSNALENLNATIDRLVDTATIRDTNVDDV